MGVNLHGVFSPAQAVARRMLDQPGKTYRSITFVTLVSIAMASIKRAEYCVAKAGAAMMSELFAVRLVPTGSAYSDCARGSSPPI